MALDDVYRVYREVIGAAIQLLRPQVEVTTISLEALEQEVARLDPQVVLCSRDRPANLTPEVAWAKIPINLGPQWSKFTVPTLLEVIDRAEETSSAEGLERGRKRRTAPPLPFSSGLNKQSAREGRS